MWKIAKVIPLYKGKGDETISSSYRLINLTNIACKILEWIMVSSLTSYLQDNKLLNKAQYGFQCGKSATTNLLECDSYTADVLNRGGSCDVILFNFQQAFDKIDRRILCRKLQSLCINGCYLLSNCWQYVAYSSATSSLLPALFGVVQGSVVGPC